MASINELATFQGSKEEFATLLTKEVDAGNITQEVADAFLEAFSPNKETTPPDPNVQKVMDAAETNTLPTQEEIIAQQREDYAVVAQKRLDEAAAQRPWYDLRIQVGSPSMRGASIEELKALGNEAALAELAERSRIEQMSFLESLTDSEALTRMGIAALKGPDQAVDAIVVGGPALIGKGIEYVTGADLGSDDVLAELQKEQQLDNMTAGLGSPISPTETLAESLTGAAVPGGFLNKLVGVGTDFMLDQTVRELTDDQGEKYETVFDRIGITDNNQRPVLGTMAALGAVLLGGTVTARSIQQLMKTRVSTDGMRIRPVKELDQNAPENLQTIEKASDLTKTNIVDEQQALRDIIQRHGVADFEDINTRIELDTHAASRTRVEEAINTGQLTTANGSFRAPIAPRNLHDAYHSLDKVVKKNVATYINLKDMRDDIEIAIGKGKATDADLFAIDQQLQSIVKNFPEAEEFSKRYNSITSSLREFAQGSLFSADYKAHLDKTRPNYVPLELSNVDPDAPLLQRLSQAQTGDGKVNSEWFQQNRESLGQYDMRRRLDPFDMLIQSVEATLTARMKNDTKLAILDALEGSSVNQSLLAEGKFTVRKTGKQSTTKVPPVPEGHVRFYHGGEDANTGGSRWVAPDEEYARKFRSNGKDKKVWYVDIPKDDPAAINARLWDEIDEAGQTNMVGRYGNVELPEEWATRLQPYETKRIKDKLLSSEEVANNPNRTVTVYRDGEKETWIVPQLTAQLLKFDPYIAKYPALFIPKRLFEQSAVGPLSVTFAPVTMLRDAIGGRVTAPGTIETANLLETAKAVPQQLWAKALGSISSHFQQSIVSGRDAFPTWLMSSANQKKYADNVAQAYTQTLYHQANASGGFDASLMKERMQVGEGALEEVRRSISSMTGDFSIPGATFSKNRISNMIHGWKAMFNAIQDAPRFAAIVKNVKNGMDVGTATAEARKLTGDVSKSGRVYDANGKRIKVDAADQGLLNVANKALGMTTEALREATPFFNPMIQGNRRLLQAMLDDPVGFNIRAWQNIGIPSLAAFGWNEMLGKEYNDYAMNERSARDVVMNMYIAIPGLPPQQGIEIPLMHELLIFSAPFTRSLYGMSRGENTEKTRAAFSIVAENILSNSLDIGYPVMGQVAANISGYASPDSLLSPMSGVYKIREDNIGILPENIEHLARTQFASIGDTAAHVANAVAGDPTFETFYKEMRDRTLDSVPIVKNLSGRKTSNTMFSIPSAIANQRFDAVAKFREYYNAFYEPKRFNEDGMQKPNSEKDFTAFKNVENPLENEDLPFLMTGPETLQEPTNPLYQEFGGLLVDNIFRGDQGMTALTSRADIYSKFIARLKDYNNGDADALREWQAKLSGIEPVDENTKELQNIIEKGGYSLIDYTDRIRLINEIERRRAEIVNSQIDTFDKVEEMITQILRERGDLGPDEEFSVTKHLDPFDAAPLQ